MMRDTLAATRRENSLSDDKPASHHFNILNLDKVINKICFFDNSPIANLDVHNLRTCS